MFVERFGLQFAPHPLPPLTSVSDDERNCTQPERPPAERPAKFPVRQGPGPIQDKSRRTQAEVRETIVKLLRTSCGCHRQAQKSKVHSSHTGSCFEQFREAPTVAQLVAFRWELRSLHKQDSDQKA